MNVDDGLKIHMNDDNSFSLEWDESDPRWKHLNGLTSKEIVAMIEKYVYEDEEKYGSLSESGESD